MERVRIDPIILIMGKETPKGYFGESLPLQLNPS